ncbi:hypothetical protein BC830DRAFT_1113684 [Chytriomyces sp. MP71]|nr:hypothetical protein BC830DRAFT_1113684 [Chytriomyces sp. MP71]
MFIISLFFLAAGPQVFAQITSLDWNATSTESIADAITFPLQSSLDLAFGATVAASSTATTGACSLVSCDAQQVVLNAPNSTIDAGQWVSAPGPCDADWTSAATGSISPVGRRNETLTVDWSGTFGTQLMSEVRVRYGSVAVNPWAVELVIYSETTMTANPVVVPIADGSQFHAFTFEQPVNASGIELIFYGLQSRDGGQTCFLSVTNVEAWSGTPPDAITYSPYNVTDAGTDISIGGLVAATVLPIIAILACISAGFWLWNIRNKNLIARNLTLTRDIEFRKKMQRSESRVHRLVDEEEVEIEMDALPLPAEAVHGNFAWNGEA